jgi:hypothetical protein
MTNALVSPDRKMLYGFKREKIRTDFTACNEHSDVKKTQKLVDQVGSRLS